MFVPASVSETFSPGSGEALNLNTRTGSIRLSCEWKLFFRSSPFWFLASFVPHVLHAKQFHLAKELSRGVFHLHYYSFHLANTGPLKLEVTTKKVIIYTENNNLNQYIWPSETVRIGNCHWSMADSASKTKAVYFYILLNGQFLASGRDCVFPRPNKCWFPEQLEAPRLDRCASAHKKHKSCCC